MKFIIFVYPEQNNALFLLKQIKMRKIKTQFGFRILRELNKIDDSSRPD
jgi:hypothetical protein